MAEPAAVERALDGLWPASTAPGLRKRHRAQLLSLVAALLCTYAFFLPQPAWNQNSRLALTRAIVEHGSTVIDPYHHTTGDKSYRNGHFYCDKAPGTSLLAIPAYAAFVALRRVVGAPLPSAQVEPLDKTLASADLRPSPDEMKAGDRLSYGLAHRIALWICNLGSVIPVAGLGMLALYGLVVRTSGVPPPAAHQAGLTAVVVYGLCSPAMPYATSFYGHRLCADFLILGAALILIEDEGPARGWWAGLALGLAVLCEYPAAVPVALLSIVALVRRGLPFAARMVATGAACAAALAAYHTVAFGHPLATGYDFVYLPEFAEGMKVRYGIHIPEAAVALQLTFGSYRGLFYLSPVLLLCVWGLAVAARRGEPSDADALPTIPALATAVTVAICTFYLALNSGYYMWDGGAAFGPRHCIPMLPFLALAAGAARARVPFAFWSLAGISAAVMLMGAAAGPEAPGHGDPVWAYALWSTREGGLGLGHGRAHTLGHLLGLRGVWSFVPLVLVWASLRPWRASTDPVEAGAPHEKPKK